MLILIRILWFDAFGGNHRKTRVIFFYTHHTARSEHCGPMNEGKLGFKNFGNFVLLVKLTWRVLCLSRKNRLCIKVLTAMYKVGNNWLRAGVAKFGKGQPILFGKERL